MSSIDSGSKKSFDAIELAFIDLESTSNVIHSIIDSSTRESHIRAAAKAASPSAGIDEENEVSLTPPTLSRIGAPPQPPPDHDDGDDVVVEDDGGKDELAMDDHGVRDVVINVVNNQQQDGVKDFDTAAIDPPDPMSLGAPPPPPPESTESNDDDDDDDDGKCDTEPPMLPSKPHSARSRVITPKVPADHGVGLPHDESTSRPILPARATDRQISSVARSVSAHNPAKRPEAKPVGPYPSLPPKPTTRRTSIQPFTGSGAIGTSGSPSATSSTDSVVRFKKRKGVGYASVRGRRGMLNHRPAQRPVVVIPEAPPRAVTTPSSTQMPIPESRQRSSSTDRRDSGSKIVHRPSVPTKPVLPPKPSAPSHAPAVVPVLPVTTALPVQPIDRLRLSTKNSRAATHGNTYPLPLLVTIQRAWRRALTRRAIKRSALPLYSYHRLMRVLNALISTEKCFQLALKCIEEGYRAPISSLSNEGDKKALQYVFPMGELPALHITLSNLSQKKDVGESSIEHLSSIDGKEEIPCDDETKENEDGEKEIDEKVEKGKEDDGKDNKAAAIEQPQSGNDDDSEDGDDDDDDEKQQENEKVKDIKDTEHQSSHHESSASHVPTSSPPALDILSALASASETLRQALQVVLDKCTPLQASCAGLKMPLLRYIQILVAYREYCGPCLAHLASLRRCSAIVNDTTKGKEAADAPASSTAEFLRKADECTGTTLEALMLLPVRRVHAYRGMLQDLQGCLPSTHEDHAPLGLLVQALYDTFHHQSSALADDDDDDGNGDDGENASGAKNPPSSSSLSNAGGGVDGDDSITTGGNNDDGNGGDTISPPLPRAPLLRLDLDAFAVSCYNEPLPLTPSHRWPGSPVPQLPFTPHPPLPFTPLPTLRLTSPPPTLPNTPAGTFRSDKRGGSTAGGADRIQRPNESPDESHPSSEARAVDVEVSKDDLKKDEGHDGDERPKEDNSEDPKVDGEGSEPKGGKKKKAKKDKKAKKSAKKEKKGLRKEAKKAAKKQQKENAPPARNRFGGTKSVLVGRGRRRRTRGFSVAEPESGVGLGEPLYTAHVLQRVRNRPLRLNIPVGTRVKVLKENDQTKEVLLNFEGTYCWVHMKKIEKVDDDQNITKDNDREPIEGLEVGSEDGKVSKINNKSKAKKKTKKKGKKKTKLKEKVKEEEKEKEEKKEEKEEEEKEQKEEKEKEEEEKEQKEEKEKEEEEKEQKEQKEEKEEKKEEEKEEKKEKEKEEKKEEKKDDKEEDEEMKKKEKEEEEESKEEEKEEENKEEEEKGIKTGEEKEEEKDENEDEKSNADDIDSSPLRPPSESSSSTPSSDEDDGGDEETHNDDTKAAEKDTRIEPRDTVVATDDDKDKSSKAKDGENVSNTKEKGTKAKKKKKKKGKTKGVKSNKSASGAGPSGESTDGGGDKSSKNQNKKKKKKSKMAKKTDGDGEEKSTSKVEVQKDDKKSNEDEKSHSKNTTDKKKKKKRKKSTNE